MRIIFTALFCCALAAAQAPVGEITGTVTDPSGAVISAASVTIVNAGINLRRTLATNASGIFSAPALPPGTYSIRVEAAGFSTQVRGDVGLQVAQVARLDFVLQVGNVSETIEVTGGAPVLETETTALGTVIENRRIVELPLNGRNYLQLASLIPGATTSAAPSRVAQLRLGGARADFNLNISGQRFSFNNYTLDGLENTDLNFNTYMLLPSIDALQEFKVESGVFAAEYGRGTSQVNVITKSGTNSFHGVAFEFLRNARLDAKNYFDRASDPIPPFKRNQFGFTAGGPVTIPKLINGRDRLFFLFNYEGLRERKSLTTINTMPLAAERAGDFSASSRLIFDPNTRVFNAQGRVTSVTAFPGNRIPASRLHPTSAKALAEFFPLPNLGSGAGNNHINNEPRRTDGDQYTGRADWVQSASRNFFFRYSHANDLQYVPTRVPTLGNNVDVRNRQGMLSYTQLAGATRVNDLKLGVSRMEALNINTRAFTDNVVQRLGISPQITQDVPLYYGVPVFNISGFSSVGECDDCPFVSYATVFQARDDFSWTKGRHGIKFGVEYRRSRFNQTGAGRVRGRFGFDGRFSQNPLAASPAATGAPMADFLLGWMSGSEGMIGAPVANYRNYYYALYIQDSWKVTPRLTVNYGLRYENEPPYLDKHDSIVNLQFRWDHSIEPVWVRAGSGDPFEGNPAFPLPSDLQYVRDGRFGRRLQVNDRNDWAPRLGIAWQITPKTVLRTGAGIYYARDIGNADFELVRNPPFTVQRAETANQFLPNLTWNSPYDGVFRPSFTLANQWGERTPYVGQWSFGIQRQLAAETSLEVTYLGSFGAKLRRLMSYNVAPPGVGNVNDRRAFPLVGSVQLQNGPAHSSYHGLQTRLTRRFARGFTLLSSFSYSKSIDNASAIRSASTESLRPPNPHDLGPERGRSSFDFRKRWTTSWLYELPFGRGKRWLANSSRVADAVLGGWQLGGILTLQDGFPITAYCGPGNIQNGGDGCYPDAVGIPADLARSEQTPTRFFNTAAFVDRLPGGAQFRYGNSARNTITGPGILNWDFSLNKNFRLSEKTKLEFRSEFFNLPNHPIFGPPGTNLRTPTYGVISSTAVDSRQIQLALKLSF